MNPGDPNPGRFARLWGTRGKEEPLRWRIEHDVPLPILERVLEECYRWRTPARALGRRRAGLRQKLALVFLLHRYLINLRCGGPGGLFRSLDPQDPREGGELFQSRRQGGSARRRLLLRPPRWNTS